MKFYLAMLTYLAMAAMLAWGILLAVQPGGKPWLLLAALATYLVTMARTGCAETH
jgi:hypothetical protein